MKNVLIKVIIVIFLVCMPTSGTNSKTDSYTPMLPEKSIPGIEHIEVTDNTLTVYSKTGTTEIDKNTGLVTSTKPLAFSFSTYSYSTHYASTSSKPFLRNKGFNTTSNLLTKYEPFVFGNDFVCLIGEEIIGVYKGKIAWRRDQPNRYNRIDELSDSCIVFHGGAGMMVIEKATGIVVLECTYPPTPLSFIMGIDSNRTMSFIKDDQVAIIDNCFVVSIEGCSRLLWDLPIKGLPFILKDEIGIIQRFLSKPDQAIYLDKFTGEKRKEVVLAYEGMPNPSPPNSYGISGVTQNTAYGWMKTNPLSIFGFDIATGKILFSKPLSCQNQKHEIFDDGKSIYYVSPAGIEKIEPASGRTLWRSPLPDNIRFVDGPDDLYAFWPTYGKDGELENSISRFDSQEKVLSSCPYIDYSHSENFTPNLVPTKYGIVWVPQNGEGDGPILTGADGTTKIYKLDKWSEYMNPGHACDGETLFVNYNGASVSCIDLGTGNIDNIQASETEPTRKDVKKILLANDRWIFTDAGDYYWLVISRTDKNTKKFLKHKQSYSRALMNEDCVVLSGTTVFGLRTYFQNTYPGDFLCFCEGGLLVQYNDGIVFIDSERGEFKKIATIKDRVGESLKIGNILVSGGFMADIDKGKIVQKMLSGMHSNLDEMATFNNKVVMSENGGYSIFSPCPSFSVKRTGKGGVKDGGGGNEKLIGDKVGVDAIDTVNEVDGVDGIDEVSFEFKNTREDGRDLVLKGEVYLVSWGDDGKAPVFAKLNEPRHKLGPLLPGMSQEIRFKVPGKDLSIQNIPQTKDSSSLKYFALVVESNGLMDREKSVLSEYDKDPRPLFDGTPVALDQQKAIAVTVWGR